jgi:hypothetical protein
MLLILVGILDLGRIYTTMLSVEAAAREAADYGTLYPWFWDPAFEPVTVAEMERRACTASSNLTDFEGNTDTCTNPSFSYVVHDQGHADCSKVPRLDPNPCQVEVQLEYDFRLLLPSSLLGIPQQLTFTRTSIFEVSDFEIDPGAPTSAPTAGP